MRRLRRETAPLKLGSRNRQRLGLPQETQHETGRKTYRRNTPTRMLWLSLGLPADMTSFLWSFGLCWISFLV
jgi:hypothetical protein